MQNSPALWRLDGLDTTLLIVQDHDVPRLAWFGPRLAAELTLSQVLALDDTALPHGGLDALTPLSLFPQASTGYCGCAALNAHRNGAQFAHRLTTVAVEQHDNRVTVQLKDVNADISVDLCIVLHAQSDVAEFYTTLSNTGKTAYTVDWLASATVPLPGTFQECLTHHGRWGLENQAYRRTISPGRLDITNLHGRTSHEHAPGLVTGTPGFGNDNGDVSFAHLAWSGNFSLRVEKQSNGNVALQAGVMFLPGECILQAGQSLQTPTLCLTRGTGMNTCTQRFHRYARQSILPSFTRAPRPVHANSWEAVYFNHNATELFTLIDAAARTGAERFVLDDGWFRHRRKDDAGLGDWYVDDTVYPDGLTPVVEHVRKNNMQFGLWFEPEMINPDSDLYRAHPDWILRLDHVATPLARNQLVLDIARPDVTDYLFERITTLVEKYAIDYIKWDHNRNLVLPGDGNAARAARQPPALYQLLERIVTRCPGLEIETCSSGGARCDLGVLRHTGRVWTSDNIDPVERASIQQGFLRFMPPEIMGAHVGHEHAHLTGRATSLHTRAVVALQGQYGFELDARKLDEHEMATLEHYTQLYKDHRKWLGNSTFWQLSPSTPALIASGNVDEPQDQAMYSVIAVSNMAETQPGHLLLAGLDTNGRYRLQLQSCNLDELAPFNKIMPAWCNQGVDTTGQLLMTLGVPLPVMPPQSALLFGCTRQY